MTLQPKDVALWLSILVGLATGVSAHVDSRARGEFNQEQISELKGQVQDARDEGRATRDMAIETRSQVGQILSAVSRVEGKLDARPIVGAAQ